MASRREAVEAVLTKIGDRQKALGLWALHCATLEASREVWKVEGGGKSFADWLGEHPENPTTIAREAGVLELGDDWFGAGVPDDQPDVEAWINAAPAISAWAVLMDGQWSERGEMGWFGMSSNEKPEGDWQAAVQELIDGLPADKIITVVDCHI